MEKWPSVEANSYSAGEEISFYGIWGFIIAFTDHVTGSYPEPHESSPQTHIQFT
jgi:hypothetical protein